MTSCDSPPQVRTLSTSRSSSIALMAPKIEAELDFELGSEVPHSNPGLSPKFYKLHKPSFTVIGGDQLRHGGPPNVFTKQYAGLLFQYAAVGLVDGVLPNTIYPFFQLYLNVSGRTSATAGSLVLIPWAFRGFYGILSDCVPIYGYRRRPYILIGWSIALAMLVLMGLTQPAEPYFTDPKYRRTPVSEYTPEIEATINHEASDAGSKYVLMMMFCTFGYIMTDVVSDGIIVELAQREPLAVRGKTQIAVYTVRASFGVVARALSTVAFNGPEYGGDFGFSLSFPTVMLILAGCVVPVIPITWLFIEEHQYPRVNFGQYMSALWTIVQMRAVYQVIGYLFIHGVLWSYWYTSLTVVQDVWAGVKPLNESISGLISTGLYSLTLWLMGQYGLNWSWRRLLLIANVSVLVLDATCTFMTIWDIVRSQWFWLGIPIAQQLPYGLAFLVTTFVSVEITIEGYESAMFGLMTSITNLASPLSNSLVLMVDSNWDLSTERFEADTTAIRIDVTITALIMYTVNLSSLLALFLLPRQREETQLLKEFGGSSRLMGLVTVAYVTMGFTWAVVTNLMVLFPSTACLPIAGGSGC